jgi:plasmid stabilization system protein ParE
MFHVQILSEAWQDMHEIYDHIENVYFAPETAERYFNGMLEKIHSLTEHADIYASSDYDYIQDRYGPEARHINYKKVTIIYTIHDDHVIIRAVIAGSLIR